MSTVCFVVYPADRCKPVPLFRNAVVVVVTTSIDTGSEMQYSSSTGSVVVVQARCRRGYRLDNGRTSIALLCASSNDTSSTQPKWNMPHKADLCTRMFYFEYISYMLFAKSGIATCNSIACVFIPPGPTNNPSISSYENQLNLESELQPPVLFFISKLLCSPGLKRICEWCALMVRACDT